MFGSCTTKGGDFLFSWLISSIYKTRNSHCYSVRLTVFGQISMSRCHYSQAHNFGEAINYLTVEVGVKINRNVEACILYV